MTPHAANWYAGEEPWSTIYGLPLRLAADARRFDTSPAWFGVLGSGLTLPWLASLDGAAVESHCLGLANRLRAELDLPPSDSAIVSLLDRGRRRRAGHAPASVRLCAQARCGSASTCTTPTTTSTARSTRCAANRRPARSATAIDHTSIVSPVSRSTGISSVPPRPLAHRPRGPHRQRRGHQTDRAPRRRQHQHQGQHERQRQQRLIQQAGAGVAEPHGQRDLAGLRVGRNVAKVVGHQHRRRQAARRRPRARRRPSRPAAPGCTACRAPRPGRRTRTPRPRRGPVAIRLRAAGVQPRARDARGAHRDQPRLAHRRPAPGPPPRRRPGSPRRRSARPAATPAATRPAAAVRPARRRCPGCRRSSRWRSSRRRSAPATPPAPAGPSTTRRRPARPPLRCRR